MTVTIAVLKETQPRERRVALTPSVAEKLAKLGVQVALQSGAGAAANFSDSAYRDIPASADPADALAQADVLLAVQPPDPEVAALLKEGSILVSFLHPTANRDLIEVLCKRRVTALAMELVPRITRAQSMDALSSQAALAGYYGALIGATQLGRILPMMTTAAGSLRPAKALVMGLGVAGLQAIATARRLGAVVEGYDVRPETKEQAASLGAKFVETGVDARGEGGYARQLTPEEQATVAAAVTRHIQQADLVITSAAVPGRAAPRLISKQQVDGMKPGAVIVDLAADSGGNCEYTCPGETIQAGPATIVGPLNVPSMLAEHASELYARNLANLLELIVKDKALALDREDEIVRKMMVTDNGEVVNDAVRDALGKVSVEG